MSIRASIEPRLPGWLASDFGLPVWSVEPVAGGLDPAAAVWSARSPDGRAWAVKWTKRDNRFGLLLASALSSASVAGVPQQLRATSGDPWSDREGGRLSVSAWVAGHEAFETGLAHHEWEALGRLLRHVHDESPPEVAGVTDDMTAVRRGIRRADARTRRRLRQVDRLIVEVEAGRGGVGQGDVDPEIARLARHWPTIRRRIDDLLRAAGRLKRTRRPTDRVSCHGDPHLGNVLVDEAGQPWLIDFDDAVVAPREVDLMLIELGVLYSMPVGDLDRQSFHRGYGPAPLDDDRIVRFGCVRATEDLAQAAHGLLVDGPERDPAALERLIDGVLSPEGLAGLVEGRLAESRLAES